MAFNANQFLEDNNLPNTNRGKHGRTGWIQTHCPFCPGGDNWHLGFNIEQEYTNCWRCGWHSIVDSIMKLLNCNFTVAKIHIKKYQSHDPSFASYDRSIDFAKKISLPASSRSLLKSHKTYLRNRGFDPDELVSEWGLQGTGPVGSYKFRIIVPIYFHNELVSYQGRDTTDIQISKYMACELQKEIIHHKHILYGIDKVRGKSVIVVEGVTDVWRLGRGSVATFGIEFTDSQVRILMDHFDSFFIFFDNEPQAQEQAIKLADRLIPFKKKVELIRTTKGDPGDMSQEEARKLKIDLLTE